MEWGLYTFLLTVASRSTWQRPDHGPLLFPVNSPLPSFFTPSSLRLRKGRLSSRLFSSARLAKQKTRPNHSISYLPSVVVVVGGLV